MNTRAKRRRRGDCAIQANTAQTNKARNRDVASIRYSAFKVKRGAQVLTCALSRLVSDGLRGCARTDGREPSRQGVEDG